MKKTNYILREILYRVYEERKPFMSQKSLAESCGLSTETVNRLVGKLHRFRSIEKKPQGFRVVDSRKVLQYWSATRDLHSDIQWTTYSADSTEEIESRLPKGSVLTAYSGYNRKFSDAPSPYDKVYVYAPPDEARRTFPEPKAVERNLIVLRPDDHLERVSGDGSAPLAQLYVDLWQIGTKTADRYRLELEGKLEPEPAETLRALIREGSSL